MLTTSDRASSAESTSSYTVRIAFHPIYGIDEDLEAFIDRFVAGDNPRFSHFAELWRQQKFIQLIYGRQNQLGLYDVLGCVFFRLVDLVKARIDRPKLAQIGALYLLYAFHGRQPIKNHVRIRVCPESWSDFVQLAGDSREEGNLDVYYIFRKMCASNAFAFCATRQVLYPGAPLFNSPQCAEDSKSAISSPTTKQRRNGNRSGNQVARHPVLQALSTPSQGLNHAVQCLDFSINHYVENKKRLCEQFRLSRSTTKAQGSEDVIEEEFPGLSLVKYPEALNNMIEIAKKLMEGHVAESLGGPSSVDGSEECRPSTSQLPQKEASKATQMSEEPEDIGERRKLLRKPCTWAEELAGQDKAIRTSGCHRSRQRPREQKRLAERMSSQTPQE